MKQVSYPLVATFMLAFIALLATSNHAIASVGRTPGTFVVSSSGSATYTIPIWAPPGPHGVQPAIALVYNSAQGNGYLGVGWSLSGLSSIYRCNQTFAQNPTPAPVTLTANDVFCMDGQQLRLASGTYGVAGSTYHTEIDNFKNVTAYGTAGNGPSYFVVQDRNGVSYQYGSAGSSQVLASGSSTALSWLLNQVSDPAGNTMTIVYAPATGTAVPSTISWTPISYGSQSYSYTMAFAYGANVPQSSTYGYVAGTPVVNTNLLSSVSINYSGSTVKKYVLTYQQSATTQRDVLTQVQECADSGATNCFAPTTITYQNGAAGVSTSSSSIGAGSANWVLANYDFNGDGYKDLLYQTSSGSWYVAFGSATGYGSGVSTGVTTAAYTASQATVLVGDLLGTGSAGLVANNGGTWSYYTWNGSGFAGASTGVPYDTTAASFALADTNGDGRADLVALNLNPSTGQANVYIRLNTSSGSSFSFASATTAFTYTDSVDSLISGLLYTADFASGPVSHLDFNGDGRQDLILGLNYRDVPDKVTLHFKFDLLGAGSTFTTGSTTGDALAPFFLNWNNDACTDLISGSVLTIAACNGSPGSTINLGYTPIAVMDWDGDGRTDLVYASSGVLYVQLSNGQGLGNTIQTSLPYNSASRYIGIDSNGDGLDDLVAWNSTAISYNLHNGVGTPPDLLTSVTDGYGNSVSSAYVSLTRSVGSAYTEWNDAQFPYENYNGPMYLTKQAVFSDPSSTSGGTYSQNYTYAGLWLNLQGRGLMPLGSVQTIDSRNGVYHTIAYQRAFPYTGLLVAETRNTNNSSSGQLLWTSTMVAQTLISSTPYQQIYFPYLSNQTVRDYELSPPTNRIVRTTSTNYSYDNYGNATNITTTVTDSDTGSPYYGQSWTAAATNTPDPNTSTWCLDLLTQTQVAYTASNGSTPVTRTRQFTPDLTNCRYTEVVTEPSSSLYKVTEDLGYDSFGNVNSDRIAGVGMSARTTTITWSNSTYPTGQFPLSVVDASGAMTQFVYNYSFGVPSSVTDPNGQTTSWLYGDGFGRKTQETRPDGTYTQWSYNDCVNWGGCLIGPHGIARAHHIYGVGGSAITDGTDFFDPIDRPLMSNTNTSALLGSYTRNEVRYDSLGRQSQQAAPCTFTSTPCTYWTTTTYDVLDRPTLVQRPISSTNTTLQTTTYQHAGDTTTITDPQNDARTLISDPNGWLRQSKDAYGYGVTLGYDAAGSRTSVTDSLSNTLWSGSYVYGVQPFLLGFTDMDRGSWGFAVDALGEATAWTDAKGQHFSGTYDALSRPLTRSEPDLFTQWTWGSSASAHNVGALQSVCTGQGTNPTSCSTSPGLSESRTYDGAARPYQRTIALPGGVIYTYVSQYNATTGLLDTLTYPVTTSGYAFKVQYGYSNGILSSVTDTSDTPNVTLWQANAQNPAGQITKVTLGNGIVINRAFDTVTHWLASLQAGVNGGAAVQNQSFLYDELGNVTQRQDNNLALTENAYYDNDYRLTSTGLNGTPNLSITYDNTMGNIIARSDVAGGAAWTYSPTQKHAVSQAGSSSYAYAYDANGNMATRQGQTIQWASYNYPTVITAGSGSTAESISLAYGPDRSRWQQIYTGNGTSETTDYIGRLMDVVISGAAVDYRHYVYAGSEQIGVYSRKSSGINSFSYLLSDHQSSVAKITNSSGAVVVSESFTPFGNRRNPATWSGSASTSDLTTAAGITRQAYTFQTQLGLWMGLNHMNGRVQDAITGRFLSADPTIPHPEDAQSYNRFSYALGNPLSRIDPTGFSDAYRPGREGDIGEGQAGDGGEVDIYGTAGGLGGSFGGGATSGSSGASLELVTVTGHHGGGTKSSSTTPPAVSPCLPGVSCWLPEGGSVTGDPDNVDMKVCGPHGVGFGLVGGVNAEAGLLATGAAAQASTGGGFFRNSTNGWSKGAFDSSGATAYAGSSSRGTPTQTSQPAVLGASVGGGASVFVTNAGSVEQLSGPFNTYSLDVGVGPAQFSVQLSTGGGIWQLSLSPPVAGETLGASVSKIVTNTETSRGGCL